MIWWYRRHPWLVSTNGQIVAQIAVVAIAMAYFLSADEFSFRLVVGLYLSFRAADYIGAMVQTEPQR